MNRKIIKMFILVTLLALLAGIASATDVSGDTDAGGITEEVSLQDTQMVSQTDTITKEANVNDNLQANESKIKKNSINKTNLKKAERYASSWDELTRKVSDVTEDTTITLTEGTYTNTGTITWNKEYILTIDGNGQTINGDQKQVFFIASGSSLILKNITITNGRSYNGPIYNSGALTITHSTLYNNNANRFGGVIYNNAGVTTITNSTLNNNNAESGGAIYNDYLGIINITNSTLNNNTATGQELYAGGGAICTWHGNAIKITNSTLNNNNADRGGAIFNWYNTAIITNSTLNNNHAHNSGGAIYSTGIVNITGNIFSNNTAGNEETIDLNEINYGTLNDNTYYNTNIALNMKLSVEDDKTIFVEGEDIALNIDIGLEHPNYYDTNVLEQIGLNKDLNKTFYINGVENVTTKDENVILSDLEPGTYTVNYVTEFNLCNYTSNNVIFKVFSSNQINEMNVTNYTELINTIERAKIVGYNTLIINLLSGNYSAAGNITWKDSDTKNVIIKGNGLTLDGQNRYQFIQIASGHNLTLENITLTNYTAQNGGAIQNQGTLTIINSTLNNNHARDLGGAIYSEGYVNITGNIFSNNTAGNEETIDLNEYEYGILNDNTYYNTNIALNMKLSVEDDKTIFVEGEDIALNIDMGLEHPNYYDTNVLEQIGLNKDLNKTFYINGVENVTTKDENVILSNLELGTYTVNYIVEFDMRNYTSNNVIFKVFSSNQINEMNVTNYTELINTIERAKIVGYNTLIINLLSGNYSAAGNITWKDSDTKNVIIKGNGLTLDGQNAYRFIQIASGHNLTLENITLTNYTAQNGGAIQNQGTLTITNSTLNNNHAYYTSKGGAIQNQGTLTITNSTLYNNNASIFGGAIYNDQYGNIIITNTTLYNNAGSMGGAIYNDQYGNIIITNSTLHNNNAGSMGGAIYNRYHGNIIITNSTLFNNNANEGGGAIYNDNGIFNITNNIFYNNTPTNFIINQDNHIQIKHDDHFISIGDFSIIVNDEKVFNGSGADDFNKYTLGDHYIKLILNGTGTNTINNVFILRKSKTKNVNGYQELIDAIGEAKLEEYEEYRINLGSGNYNAIANIKLSDSATKNIIINGNGLTLNGKKEFQFIQIAEGYNLILENITITNYTAREGGVIYNNGNLSITDSTLEKNQATETGDYGDVYAKGGVIYNNGNLSITDSTLRNNQATATVTAVLTIGQSGNAYSYGGVIYNNGNLSITNSTLDNNQATAIEEDFGNAYSYGGAIYNKGNLNITDSTLENNQATATGFSTTDAEGGAIYNRDGTTTVTRSTLHNNNAKIGGAIYNDHGTAIIIQGTLYNNYATSGGAIYNYFGIYEVIHTIFYNNTPANYIINDEKYIQLDNNDNYIPGDVTYAIYLDDEEECVYTGQLNGYTVPRTHMIRLVVNGTDTSAFVDNTFILYSYDKMVRNYTELVEAVEDAKRFDEEEYYIYLLPGDYNATDDMTWGSASGSTRKLIINGNGQTLDGIKNHQFMTVDEGYNLTLYNITLSNYTATQGGAINNNGILSITGSSLTDNTATGQNGYGGAIFNYGTLSITDSNITDNTATGQNGRGGAIYNNRGTLNITGSSLTHNNATGQTRFGYAGAIFNYGTLSITDSNITDNTATGQEYGYGGAIYNLNGTLNITGSNLTDNIATGQTYDGRGGVIFNTGNLNITGSNITDNTATGQNGYGGAIYNDNGYSLSITGSKLTNNKVTGQTYDGRGGVIYNNGGTFSITGSNITDNTATGQNRDGRGGAIYNTRGTINITNTNLTHNTATGQNGIGGAIYNHGTLTITGSNLNNNTAAGQNTGIGGVIFNDGGTLNITNSNFTHNNATGQEYAIGGVIYNTAMGILSITNTNLNNNTATGQNGLGGVIYNHNGGILNITNTNLTHNNATYGGAIVNNGTSSNLTITDSKLENNNANKDGGAIYNKQGNALIEGNTFITNTAGTSGYAIKDDSGSAAIHDNINADTSTYSSTIYTDGSDVSILSNVFYELNTNIYISSNNSNPSVFEVVNLTFLLKDQLGNPLANQIINITINDIRYNITTNDEGYNTLEYTIQANETIINAIYPGNDKYFSNTASLVMYAQKLGTQLLVDDVNAKVGEEFTINGMLNTKDNTPLKYATIKITVHDKTNTTTTNEIGQFNMTFTLDKMGEYPITVTYLGDKIYNQSINNTAKVTATKTDTKLTLNVSNTTAVNNTKINITIKLTDNNNNPIENQDINITINDEIITVKTNNNGTNTTEYTTSKIGSQTITATYHGNNMYNNNTTTTQIKVIKIDTKLTLKVSNTTPVNNTPITITAILTDINNNKLANRNITFTIDDRTYTTPTNNEAIATLNYTPTTPGKQAITATYNGDSQYNNSTAATSITVKKINTRIDLKVSNTTPVNNTPITITVTLKDTDGNKLAGQNITIIVAGKTFNVKTNANGVAIQSYTPTRVETQTITATYKGDSKYINSTVNTNITIKKINTKLSIQVSNTTPTNNTPITINVTLTDTNSNKLAGQNITITVGTKTYVLKTNAYGVATQSYTPTRVETQTITAKYNGDSQYNNSSTTASVTVKKITTKLTLKVSNSTPVNNTSITITATLTDENNNKVANQNITITVGGKTFKVKTNSNGIATQSYTPTKVETQTITATYKGDSQYVNSTATANITVKKINSKLTVKASNTTPTLNTSINITATLTDANGNKVAGQNVTINVAGKTYTVKTDTSGVATKAYTPTTVGKQTITATYKGDSKYNNSTATMNITVNKINTQLTLKVSNNTPKVTDTITITATLTDKDNQKLSNQNITITVEDKTYTVKTNNNGIATQTHKLTRAGSTNITAKYNGNNNYNPNNTSTKITVKENMQNTIMTITVNNTTPRVNDNVMVTFTLKDEKNNPIKNQEIKATINGVNTNVKTNTNGVATTNYTVAKKDRVVNITATYTGNTTLKATTGNLTIDRYYKVDMELLTGSFDSKPGQTVKLIAHIKDNGVDINGGQLVFKLNGVSLKDENGSAVIVNINNGLAVLEYKIPDTLGARTHNLTAVYASNTYGRVELTTPMIIGKYTTHIDVNPLYTTTDKITIKAQIVDQNNQALNKQTTISIKVNGKSYSLNTINGTIDYQISQSLKDGYYNITIISGENGKYLGANVKTLLIKSSTPIKTNYINNTLNKDTTAKSGDTKTSNIMSILTGSSTVKPGDRLKLIAHLSEDQVDITGGQLVFKLNGVSLKDEQRNAVVVNINDGLGVLDYKIPDTLGARTHNLTAVYSSKQYGRVELTTQLTMNRLNTHIEAEPIYTTGTTSYIKAKILDDNNQLINKQTSVVIKVDGKSYAFNTTTGFIDYKVPNTLSKGLHQITIISGENGKYISSRANTVLIKT